MTNRGPQGKEGVGFLFFSDLPLSILHGGPRGGWGNRNKRKHPNINRGEEAQPSQQTSGRRPLTDNSHTKTQLLITTHMLKCFIWTQHHVIVLRLRFLAAYLSSAERNFVLLPWECQNRTVEEDRTPAVTRCLR